MISCFGSGTGAGAAAPPPASVFSSGVDSGSCVAGGAGGSGVGACVVGIGNGAGVGLCVGDGVGLGVGDGEGDGVGVGNGDGEAITVSDGAGEPASSATDGTPHPARPAQAAMARAADADLTTILWRRDVEEETVTIKVRGNLKEIEGKMGVLTKASGYEKGW